MREGLPEGRGESGGGGIIKRYGGTITYVDLISMTVGWNLSLEELTGSTCRIHALERSFNCREGLRRKDDVLPHRFMHEEIPSGISKGLRTKPEELEEMLDEYYERRGWDSDGVPIRETLDELGLEGS